jgi:hypothetical protein
LGAAGLLVKPHYGRGRRYSNANISRLHSKNKAGDIVTHLITSEPATAAPSSAIADFVLQQIHCAALRSRIVTNQLEAATTALNAGLISPEAAILILAETGVEVSS